MGLSEIHYADECSKIGCGLRRFFGLHGHNAIDNVLWQMWCLSAAMGVLLPEWLFCLQGCRGNHKAAATCATIAQVMLHPTKHDNSVGTVYQFIWIAGSASSVSQAWQKRNCLRISSVLPDASDVAKAHAPEGERYNLRVSFASLIGQLGASCNTG